MWSLCGLCGIYVESMWSLCGVHVDFIWNVGECKIQVKSNATKRPRATNAEDLFAKEQRTHLRDAMKLQRDKLGVSSLTKEENLALYRSVKADTYNNLPSLDKEIWEAHAGKYNEDIKDLPSLE